MEDRSRRRARLVLIVGMLFALGAGVATFFYAQTQKSEAPAPIPTTQVVVAARDIPSKTQITPADVKLVKMNTEAVPSTALQSSEQVVGRITLVSIAAGEPILPSRLAGPNGAAFVVIPAEALGANGAPNPGSPNYRAMSITVADAQAAGGAIQAGDIVDVLYTLNFSPDKYLVNPQPQRNSTDVSARIVLERVPILARTLSVYVIRTDAATAERIGYLTASGGSIQFLLRGPKDDRASGTSGATFRTVQPEVKIQIPEKITP
ncbi:MAG TPA: Flp pilus assembly protein CpaB [Candidatus Limnocylindria bacterium]|nr:Flp pilus assembly protein CpaB [Candidatus Limnocylindria bacterium]